MDESSFEGTLDTVEFALINLVRSHTLLYNTNDPGNKDKQRKDLVWAEIARQLRRDEGWCLAKWKNLSDYYKKRKKIYGSNGPSSTTMRRWVYYDALSFLDIYDNAREDSFSGSGSTMVNPSAEHSRSSLDGNQNFDETQYQSLDGITDRAEVKLRHFLDPIIETQSYPATKKPRMILAATSQGHLDTVSEDCPYQSSSQNPNNLGDHCHPTAQFQISSVHSKPTVKRNTYAGTNSFSSKKNATIIGCIDDNFNSDSLNDCPHHHFCMSLAARFRKMDPATATYMQMKIMELILKTEFPDS